MRCWVSAVEGLKQFFFQKYKASVKCYTPTCMSDDVILFIIQIIPLKPLLPLPLFPPPLPLDASIIFDFQASVTIKIGQQLLIIQL